MTRKRTPQMGVAEHARVPGAMSPEDKHVPLLEVLPFEEALEKEWPTDAHFVTYRPSHEEVDYPRCNKPIIAKLRQQGYSLDRHMFALDWDTPDHRPWGETATQEEFVAQFQEMAQEFPEASEFACMYFTRAGVRIIYILSEPLEVTESEARIRWMIYKMRSLGMTGIDELVDWTRLNRMPKVVREGISTWDQDYFQMVCVPDARLDVSALGSASKADKISVYADIVPLQQGQPEYADSSLLECFETGKARPTDWAKKAKKRLINRMCFDTLYNQVPLASRGSRDTTLHQLLGECVSLLYYLEGTTPEHIYALFYDSVMSLEQDQPWDEILWSGVKRLWEKEDAKARATKQIQKEKQIAREEKTVDMIEGMQEWLPEQEELFGDRSDAMMFARKKLIANCGSDYFLMDEEGYYRPQAYSSTQLIPAIRTHIPDLIETSVPKADGSGMKDVTIGTIISRHTTIVDSVSMEPSRPRGVIEHLDEPHAKLLIPGYRRNENIIPEYDEQVAEWLEKLFGPKVDDFNRWVAFALDWEAGPICALSIQGEQGAGKKMIVQGLAECLHSPSVATEKDLSDENQYGLLQSPFLVVNEGWGTVKGKHPADTFRDITSGEGRKVYRKYHHPVDIKSPMRVIFTANNLDVIKKLCKGRTLTQTDREALAIRLMHFDVGHKASDWLRLKGGRAFTASPGRRWIAPDSGGQSDHIVASHFMYLYHKRHELWTPDNRFLVEGYGSDDLMFEMQTQVGSAVLVIETLLSMFKKSYPMNNRDGIHIDKEKGSVFIVTKTITEYFRDELSQKFRESLSQNQVANVLGGIALHDKPEPRVLPGDGSNKGRRRWYELDIHKIQRAAQRHGMLSTELDELCNKREAFHSGYAVEEGI